jgi:uncharacterized repeat protein (TIGR04076 family)
VGQYRITVLKKMANPELAGQFCQGGEAVCPCPAFQEGQEFISDGLSTPANFCSWAWDDISKYITIFESGGNMKDTFHWMKADDNVIACCTDGIRPVVFKIERLKI